MESLSAMVIKLAESLKISESIKSVIEYKTQSHYGGPELVYVTSQHKDSLQVLTGAKTLSPRHIKALEDLGFIFKKL